MKKLNADTVLFDMGGTLIHLNPSVFEKIIRKYIPSYSIPKGFRQIDIDSKGVIRIGKISDAVQNYFKEILRKLKIDQDTQRLVLKDLVDIASISSKTLWNEIDIEAQDVLSYLSKNYKLGIISNNVGDANDQLENGGLSHFFKIIVDSSIVGLEKPNPEIFLYAAGMLNTNPKRCVYIGDLYEWDALGALKAGMIPILVHSPKVLMRKEIINIGSLIELKNLL
ncbi:MAG: HAD family hydrolase [Patescibacteria group bacterium]